MEDSIHPAAKITLPLVLMAAVVQGWALFGLHHGLQFHHWPATDHAWLLALYAVAVFVPLTVQILAEHVLDRAMWLFVASLGIAFFYFGWHHGALVYGTASGPGAEQGFALALLLSILWLLALPFVQGRLQSGRWRYPYSALFTHAWRNKLLLAEAALFTGLLWLLLFLLQMLFHMLGIDYFRELFEEPIFIYPVTSLTFGCALHLIGSIERLTAVVLEQLLNLLKWLALLAGVILAMFTLALLFKLPALLFTGQKAIGAAWLLWLAAGVVLLLNAAYRDGSVLQPYPRWVAQFLRMVVPLTVVIALTALYALSARTGLYGLTVERFWAFVVAGAALIYSVGYSIAALGRGAWLAAIARVNVLVALMLIAVICLALTPLLSPYRLAADSQFGLVVSRGAEIVKPRPGRENLGRGASPLAYLHFESGQYGRERLLELTHLQSGIQAAQTRELAASELKRTTPWQDAAPVDPSPALAKMNVYPAGRSLDEDLKQVLLKDLRNEPYGLCCQSLQEHAGLYVDLNGDRADEFVLLSTYRTLLYERRNNLWVRVGELSRNSPSAALDVNSALGRGDYSVAAPKWNELTIDGHRFAVQAPDKEPTR